MLEGRRLLKALPLQVNIMEKTFEEIRPVQPHNWQELVAVCLSTPLADPNQNPLADDVIYGIPLNNCGLSGVSKTEQIRQVARILEIPLHTVGLSTKEPSDLGSVPVQTANGLQMVMMLPAARECLQVTDSVLFFDEFNNADEAVQNACMSLFSERRIGDRKLPARTRLMCAMNPLEYATNGHVITPAMANRMAHCWFAAPSLADVASYRLNGPSMKPLSAPLHELLQKGWVAADIKYEALYQGFLKRVAPDVIMNQPKPDDPTAATAWPSLRTWHWALCGLKTAEVLGVSERTKIDLIHALCGPAASAQWADWVDDAQVPTPEDMLTKGYEPNTKRLDITYTAVSGMTMYMDRLCQQEKAKAAELAPRAWDICRTLLDSGLADLAAIAGVRMSRCDLAFKLDSDDFIPEATTVLTALHGGGWADFARQMANNG
jgi:hypothetical protein